MCLLKCILYNPQCFDAWILSFFVTLNCVVVIARSSVISWIHWEWVNRNGQMSRNVEANPPLARNLNTLALCGSHTNPRTYLLLRRKFVCLFIVVVVVVLMSRFVILFVQLSDYCGASQTHLVLNISMWKMLYVKRKIPISIVLIELICVNFWMK